MTCEQGQTRRTVDASSNTATDLGYKTQHKKWVFVIWPEKWTHAEQLADQKEKSQGKGDTASKLFE